MIYVLIEWTYFVTIIFSKNCLKVDTKTTDFVYYNGYVSAFQELCQHLAPYFIDKQELDWFSDWLNYIHFESLVLFQLWRVELEVCVLKSKRHRYHEYREIL